MRATGAAGATARSPESAPRPRLARHSAPLGATANGRRTCRRVGTGVCREQRFIAADAERRGTPMPAALADSVAARHSPTAAAHPTEARARPAGGSADDATERCVADAIGWARAYHPPPEAKPADGRTGTSLAAAFGRGVREVEAAEGRRARSQLCAVSIGKSPSGSMAAAVDAALSAPICDGCRRPHRLRMRAHAHPPLRAFRERHGAPGVARLPAVPSHRTPMRAGAGRVSCGSRRRSTGRATWPAPHRVRGECMRAAVRCRASPPPHKAASIARARRLHRAAHSKAEKSISPRHNNTNKRHSFRSHKMCPESPSHRPSPSPLSHMHAIVGLLSAQLRAGAGMSFPAQLRDACM